MRYYLLSDINITDASEYRIDLLMAADIFCSFISFHFRAVFWRGT